MQLSDKREFLRELDATSEHYVREKRALGGYVDWQLPIVDYWLGERDRKRDDERRLATSQNTQKTVYWTRTRALLTAAGVFVAAAFQWLFSK